MTLLAPLLPAGTDVPGRALVVTAHPDDVDFGAAGTIASLVAGGCTVTYCIVTDGDAGGFDPAVSRSAIPAIRRAEQTEAARRVGVTDLTFLGYPDGMLEASLGLRRDVSRVIRATRPDVVLCQSPDRDFTRIYASHPDHLAAGEATFCAVYPDARNPFTFPELLAEGHEAHAARQIWVMGGPSPTHAHDISEFVEAKITALLAHESQHQDPAAMSQRVRAWTTATAARAGDRLTASMPVARRTPPPCEPRLHRRLTV
jgi:LmbE family N-acetylglucosaminyl deacetylase